MTTLTIKQRDLLRRWHRESLDRISDVADLSEEQYKTLEKISNSEILYHNVNNFLYDLKEKKRYTHTDGRGWQVEGD